MRKIIWRHQWDAKRDAEEGDAAAIECREDSLTQQQFKDDADLNVLIKRFGLEKVAIPATVTDPRYYGDVSEVPDLRSALDIVRDAENKFMQLPPDLRARFHNSPGEMWEFVNDPINAEAAVQLGLLHRPPPEAKPPVESAVTVSEGNDKA